MDSGKALTVLAGLACYALAFGGYALKVPTEMLFGLTNIGSAILGSLFVGANQTDRTGASIIAKEAADRVVKSVFPPAPPRG